MSIEEQLKFDLEVSIECRAWLTPFIMMFILVQMKEYIMEVLSHDKTCARILGIPYIPKDEMLLELPMGVTPKDPPLLMGQKPPTLPKSNPTLTITPKKPVSPIRAGLLAGPAPVPSPDFSKRYKCKEKLCKNECCRTDEFFPYCSWTCKDWDEQLERSK